jgi:hypothetical protein
MRLILAILLVLTLTGAGLASPFLVCTPDPVVEIYLIKVNGATAIEVPAPLHWDVGPLVEGQYQLEVAAKNIWGVSTYVPFDFNKIVPSSSSGIGLSPE